MESRSKGGLSDEKGASAVEYALFVALITAVIVAAVTLIGGDLKRIFEDIQRIFHRP